MQNRGLEVGKETGKRGYLKSRWGNVFSMRNRRVNNFVSECPRCEIKGVAFQIEHGGPSWKDDRGYTYSEKFAVCGVCRRGVIATFHSRIGLTGLLPSPPKPPDHLPDNVRSFFEQGINNLSQSWDAAGAMFRKTLDVTLKHKFSEIKGTLKKRIDEAANQRDLTPELAEWAHQIRLDGNEASHGEEPFSQEDAQRLATFTELVLRYLYTLPGMLEEAKRTGQ